MRSFATLSILISALLAGSVPAQGRAAAPPPTFVTQRRINEMAAALETARLALIEGTGLRRPGEGLTAYLYRIAAPLPGEPPTAFRAREQGYLAALTAAAAGTVPARRMPRLHDESPSNRQLWDRATHALSYLPKHLDRLQAAWRKRPEPNGSAPAFTTELRACLDLVIAALADLRDANP